MTKRAGYQLKHTISHFPASSNGDHYVFNNHYWPILFKIIVFCASMYTVITKQCFSMHHPRRLCQGLHATMEGYLFDPLCFPRHRHTVQSHAVHCFVVGRVKVDGLIGLESHKTCCEHHDRVSFQTMPGFQSLNRNLQNTFTIEISSWPFNNALFFAVSKILCYEVQRKNIQF